MLKLYIARLEQNSLSLFPPHISLSPIHLQCCIYWWYWIQGRWRNGSIGSLVDSIHWQKGGSWHDYVMHTVAGAMDSPLWFCLSPCATHAYLLLYSVQHRHPAYCHHNPRAHWVLSAASYVTRNLTCFPLLTHCKPRYPVYLKQNPETEVSVPFPLPGIIASPFRFY